jgi:hypothetical protein
MIGIKTLTRFFSCANFHQSGLIESFGCTRHTVTNLDNDAERELALNSLGNFLNEIQKVSRNLIDVQKWNEP